jgi:hypothetical protein
VKRHRWFKSIDWEEVYYKKMKAPIVPTVAYEGDPKNYDDYPETGLALIRFDIFISQTILKVVKSNALAFLIITYL